jgi:hypothetical protein
MQPRENLRPALPRMLNAALPMTTPLYPSYELSVDLDEEFRDRSVIQESTAGKNSTETFCRRKT